MIYHRRVTRLPPLHTLRAFEVAARLLSFRLAAEELHLTASAVSHRIRTLEEHLGVRLFERYTRRIALTSEGRSFLAPVRGAFAQIEAAAERIARAPEDSALTVQASPNFATEWLVPRLLGFQAEHPEIEVRLITILGHDQARFDFEQVDLAIWYGVGRWPELQSERLLNEHLVPVCAPALARGRKKIARPEDLKRATLLHVLVRIGQWRRWLEAAGVEVADPERGPKFQNTPLAIEAAMAGLGVAIANRAFVADHLRHGRLVVPVDIDLRTESAYYLVWPRNRRLRPGAAAFRDWITAVLAKDAR